MLGVVVLILAIAIIILFWNIFSMGRNLISSYTEKYEDGVEIDFNTADELRNILRTKYYGITQVKLLTTTSLEVYTSNGKYFLYIEDERLKAEFPDIPIGLSRISSLIFTLTATKKMKQAKEIGDILELVNSSEPTIIEFERHQNDTVILKVKNYTKALYVSIIAIVLVFVGFAIYDNVDTFDSDENDAGYDYFQIGDTISFSQDDFGEFELTFTDYGTDSHKYSNDVYTYIEYEVENTGEESVYFNDGEIECYADGYSVNNEYVIDGDYNNNLSLAAGRKVTAKVYFEVDIDEVDSLQLEYADAIWVIK